ncbi:GntR family transcriptional regulator [Exiguobacterium profundum]
MLEIDKQSPLPIYYQIEAYLKQQIDDGLLKPGDTLPSEREFSEQFHVSRMTIRQAIMNLVNAG